jgi:hypothetical protein
MINERGGGLCAMTDKERFDASLALVQFSAARWDQRRSYEWKISLGLWAILAAVVHYYRVNVLSHWYGIFILSVYFNWTWNIWWANFLDRQLMRSYRIQCSEMLAAEHVKFGGGYNRRVWNWFGDRPILNRWLGFTVDYSFHFHMVVTLFLLVLVYSNCQTKPHWPFK